MRGFSDEQATVEGSISWTYAVETVPCTSISQGEQGRGAERIFNVRTLKVLNGITVDYRCANSNRGRTMHLNLLYRYVLPPVVTRPVEQGLGLSESAKRCSAPALHFEPVHVQSVPLLKQQEAREG